MRAPEPRSREQRKVDVLHRLAHDVDVWAATGSVTPHLVPLSLDWADGRVLLVTAAGTPTAHNLLSGGGARLALGLTRDVVLVDADLEHHAPVADVAPEVVDRYTARAGWRPPPEDLLLWLRPTRIQAWREVDEMPGRTLMRDGRWC